jgi:hypothetical protein
LPKPLTNLFLFTNNLEAKIILNGIGGAGITLNIGFAEVKINSMGL